jgi:preprotein translocase subunit SecA
LIRLFSLTSPVTAEAFENQTVHQLTETVYQAALTHYQHKMEENAKRVFPVIKDVYQNPNNTFKRIVVPFTDGVRTLNVVSDLETAFESEGKNLVNDFEKNISLAIIDESWKDHLRKMDELKQSVQLAVHEQKDPLLIYKFESFELFRAFMDNVNRDIISFLFKGELPTQDPNNIREARATRRKDRINTSKEEVLNQDQQAMRQAAQHSGRTQATQVETIVRERPKIGRNERVDIQHVVSGERKTVKFKQAEPLLAKGEWVLIEDN